MKIQHGDLLIALREIAPRTNEVIYMTDQEFWVGMSFLIFTLLMVGGITVAVFWDTKKGKTASK